MVTHVVHTAFECNTPSSCAAAAEVKKRRVLHNAGVHSRKHNQLQKSVISSLPSYRVASIKRRPFPDINIGSESWAAPLYCGVLLLACLYFSHPHILSKPSSILNKPFSFLTGQLRISCCKIIITESLKQHCICLRFTTGKRLMKETVIKQWPVSAF